MTGTNEGGNMPRRFVVLVVVVLVGLMRAGGAAQEPDARTVLQAALKAMGGENLRSIQYSGNEGYVAAVGQNYNPANDWPAPLITTYTRTIDYEARSSREEYGLTTERPAQYGPVGGGNSPVITTPIIGEQRRNWNVRETFAWNVDGTNIVPQPALADLRQLEIWLTPHGCLKAALAPGANPVAIERTEQNKGRITAVSFVALGKYRVQCSMNSKNLVERVQTWLPNPVVGDLYHELVYGDYKDFNGVMFPTDWHAHHDLDDDLEGQGINVSGGHNSFGLTVSALRVNIADAAPAIPEAARTATVPPVQVQAQKIADGVFYMGGGTHASVAVEFRDFITVFDAPLNEARSLAVIREIKRLIPNKPIRYVVSSHHHWDHLGGLRAYVASENVTVVMQQNNLPYYAEVLWIRPWTLQPDRLALFPPEEVSEGYTFETVGQKHVLSDGTRTMEIYNVQGLQHAQGMVMAYLPQEKMVLEADLFTPPAPNAPMPTLVTASHRTFLSNVQRLRLDVQTIVPIHGGRTFPWGDFAKFVTSAKPATN
jgi:glyoxylase-like metal-dependent hydrolase (beta-lactamase superfamily II)